MITSAEEAIDLQKRNSALNRFYWNFSQPDKDKTSHVANYGKLMKRDVGERVVVSYQILSPFVYTKVIDAGQNQNNATIKLKNKK